MQILIMEKCLNEAMELINKMAPHAANTYDANVQYWW